MKRLLLPLSVCATLMFTTQLSAAEIEHFKGLPAETLEQAFSHFSEYNEKLSQVLAGELTQEKITEIHELTYTLENALGKIQEETESLAETLEALHLASETYDAAAVKTQGDAYLEQARALIK